MASTKGRSNHSWGAGSRPNTDEFATICEHCALEERQVWLLDEDGRAVIGLVWLRPGGSAVAIHPFAYSKNRRPESRPTRSWAEQFAGVPRSGTPECPKSPEGWYP